MSDAEDSAEKVASAEEDASTSTSEWSIPETNATLAAFARQATAEAEAGGGVPHASTPAAEDDVRLDAADVEELSRRFYRVWLSDAHLDPARMEDICARAGAVGASLICARCEEPLHLFSVTATSLGSTFSGSACTLELSKWLCVSKGGALYNEARDSSRCFSCLLLDMVRERLRGCV